MTSEARLSASHGLWAATAPPAPATEQLDRTRRADVAVIGAGYTGLSAALHLADAGATVVVLEAGEIGAGGSGRNVGLVNAGLWLPPDDMERRLGPDHGPRLLDALAAGPAMVWNLVRRHSMDCEATPNGTLHCAADARGMRALRTRAAQWQARGAPVTMLDRRAATERLGSEAFAGALFDPRAGTIQPLGYARELARAAQRAGAMICTRSPVTELQRSGGTWHLRCPGGSVAADRVIIATNAYSLPPLDGIAREMTFLPYFNFATDPIDEKALSEILPGREGAWDTRKLLTSFRLDARGRLIIGSVGALGRVDGPVNRAWAARRMAQLFPRLTGTPLVQGWYGMIGTTSDAVPRLHEHGPGAWSVSGYNGRGIAPGTVFGQLLADLALGRRTRASLPLPVSPLHGDRLRTPRHALFRAGAALWHLCTGRARG